MTRGKGLKFPKICGRLMYMTPLVIASSSRVPIRGDEAERGIMKKGEGSLCSVSGGVVHL